MTYEVELKFPLDEPEEVLSRLVALGAERREEIRQVDRYFNHPSRDFAQTDEAFRIRSMGEKNLAAYKGPLVDPHSKTRRELEVPLGEGGTNAERFVEVLAALGFEEIQSVGKSRVPFALQWEGRTLEVVLDEVDGLGTFLEIETFADEARREEARDSILRLAERLELRNAERRSYLRLLLEQEEK